MSLFGPPDPPLVRSILDGLGAPLWSIDCPARLVRDEDVRALAMEHEERRSLGLVDQTEADTLPGWTGPLSYAF